MVVSLTDTDLNVVTYRQHGQMYSYLYVGLWDGIGSHLVSSNHDTLYSWNGHR